LPGQRQKQGSPALTVAADRSRHPREDLLTVIARELVTDGGVSDEVAGLCTLLSVAGTETTFSLRSSTYTTRGSELLPIAVI
jgi:cytochrome P450